MKEGEKKKQTRGGKGVVKIPKKSAVRGFGRYVQSRLGCAMQCKTFT